MRQIILFLSILSLSFFWSCGNENNEDSTEQKQTVNPVERDLNDITSTGKLTALTSYSATSYFIYRGQPMGYEYELLKLLSEALNLDLEIIVIRNLDEIFKQLNSGRGDIIAHGLTITKERKKRVDFTKHHYIIYQVLVQQRPDNWLQMKQHEIDKMLIRSPIELIGKQVHVRKNSSYYARLLNLSEEIGGDIEIVQVAGDYSTDDLIKQVSDGEIKYTVADDNIAKINQAYYHNIDIKTRVSLPQRIAWAVRSNSPQLLKAVNRWILEKKKETDYYVIFNKYFENRRAFKKRMHSEYFSQTGGKISKYDPLIKANAKRIGWDWRLMASQIYQESQFNPTRKSWAGAVGLMQLMPNTAKEFGASKLKNPEQNIQAGASYIEWLENLWQEIPDSSERLKFVLASYNAGQGHVQDARRLAEKLDKDPDLWDNNVAECILLKSKQKYFNDPVVKYGYCRGEEPYNYVKEILERYENVIVHHLSYLLQ